MGDDNAADTPLQQSVAMAIAGSSVFASSDSRVESTSVQVRRMGQGYSSIPGFLFFHVVHWTSKF